jgi:hypothetical protein
MRLVRLAATALALSLLAPRISRSDTPFVPGLQNGCAGMKLSNYEATEPQCVFGLCTPKADANTVAHALDLNNKRALQHLEWRSQKMDGKPWTWTDYQAKYPPEDRIDSYLRFVSFQFDLGPLCQLAKKNGFGALKLACDVYTSSTAGCFIAAYKEGDPSFNDNSIKTVNKHRWGPVSSNLEPDVAIDWQEEQMDDPNYRASLYTELLNTAVNRTFSAFDQSARTIGPVNLEELNREASTGQCRGADGQPLSDNALPLHDKLPSEPSQNQRTPASIPN